MTSGAVHVWSAIILVKPTALVSRVFLVAHSSDQSSVVILQTGVCLHPTDTWPACFSFVINATIFFMLMLVFPGSQGKPNTQIPQRRSETQWPATDYAEISKLLRQIPMLTCIHVIGGGESTSCSAPLTCREGAVICMWFPQSQHLYLAPLSFVEKFNSVWGRWQRHSVLRAIQSPWPHFYV